mmetsp:Transcript_23541/g.76095  ORF Transcript_23541/g.76095 Transcript_23541/m.76095 type:complete len:202 (-) Transcript_23541:504-1109(-)
MPRLGSGRAGSGSDGPQPGVGSGEAVADHFRRTLPWGHRAQRRGRRDRRGGRHAGGRPHAGPQDGPLAAGLTARPILGSINWRNRIRLCYRRRVSALHKSLLDSLGSVPGAGGPHLERHGTADAKGTGRAALDGPRFRRRLRRVRHRLALAGGVWPARASGMAALGHLRGYWNVCYSRLDHPASRRRRGGDGVAPAQSGRA